MMASVGPLEITEDYMKSVIDLATDGLGLIGHAYHLLCLRRRALKPDIVLEV